MSKYICEDGRHILHKWSDWNIEKATFALGVLYGKRAGQHIDATVRVRACKNCKYVDWREL